MGFSSSRLTSVVRMPDESAAGDRQDDPHGDAIRDGFERRRPWAWAFAVFLGVGTVVRELDAHGLEPQAFLNIATGVTFWTLITWRIASRLDRDATTLWRRLTLGWAAWLVVWVAIMIVSLTQGAFRPATLIALVLAASQMLLNRYSWRRTVRGLPPVATPEEFEERRERRRST